jgi:hypothetical protein
LGQARPQKSARAPLSPSPPTAVGRSPDSLAAQYSPTAPLLSRSLTAGPTLSSPTSGVPNPDSTAPPPSPPWTRLPRRGPHAKRCPVLFKPPPPPLGRNRAPSPIRRTRRFPEQGEATRSSRISSRTFFATSRHRGSTRSAAAPCRSGRHLGRPPPACVGRSPSPPPPVSRPAWSP